MTQLYIMKGILDLGVYTVTCVPHTHRYITNILIYIQTDLKILKYNVNSI